MKNKRLITKLTKVMYVFGILFLLTGLLLSAVQMPVSAQATTGGGGSIWTTRGDCGKLSQDVNQFSVGEDVYINGGGFAPTTTYNWFIIGNPGSSDAGIKVAEGTVTTNGQGKFCFYAYTIQEGDSGVYKNDVNGKNDNYSIRESTGSASLTLDKSTTTTGFNAVGDTINYSYVLTNSSTNFWIRLRAPYAVSDDKVSVTCPTTPAELGIGQSVTCTANPYTITQADLDRGFVTNVATATAKTGMDGSQTVTSNQDSETVEGTQNTGLGLQKSANPIIYSTEGEIIGYSYVLTNTGNVTLSAPFSVDDDVIGKFSCAGAPATLAPGASFTCSGGYSITLADLDNGSVTNHATASATFGGGVVNSGEKSATINASQNPALQIVKSSPQTVFSAASQSITYHYELTNMGNVTLTGFTVTDDKIGSVTNCDKTSLAPGESTTCSGTYTTTQTDMDAGEVQNTAFGTGYFKSSPVQSAPDTLVIPAQGIGSQLSLVKLVDPTTYNAVNQELSYTYTLTNSGDVTLTGFNITDDKLGSITNCDKSTLAPTESTTCTASITITQADLDAGSITNKATGYGSYNSKQVVSNEASATATALGAAGLTLNKEVSPATFTAVGDVLDYTYTLTNSGAVTLSGPFTVSDDKATVVCPEDVTLGVGASIECTASYTITLADLNAGFVTNTATGHAVFNGSPVNSDPDSATANAQQVPALSLAKSATETSYDAVGDILHYSYQLTNIGNVTLTSPFTVTDDKTTVTCPASPASLAPGEFTTCTADYTVTQADLDAGKVTNTAQGHVTYDASVIDSNFDSATVNADQNPALHLDKTADEDTFDAVGDILHYNYLVTNIGNVTLYDSFAVHDDRIGLVDCSAAPASLAPGASFICHGTFTIRQYDLNWGAVSNTAEARASTDPVDCCASVIWSNEDTLTVYGIKPGADLTLEKTVSPETYDAAGQVLTYTYKLLNTGGVTLFGLFAVTDDKLTVDCSAAATSLEPGESTNCTATHTITQADLDAGEIINDAQAFGKDMWEATVSSNHDTATATGTQNPELTLEKTVLPETFEAVDEVLNYTYTLTNSGNVNLSGPFTVTDDKTTVDCSIAPSSLAPGEFITCSATYTITQADMDAMVVTNKANGHGFFGTNEVTSNQATATATGNISGPALQIVKSVTETSYSLVGNVLHYTYELKNIGDVTLWGPFKVFDDKSTDEYCDLGLVTDTLAPDATTTCTATYTVTVADLISGSVTNVAYAEGFFNGQSILSETDDATVNAALITPTVTIQNIEQATCAEPAGEVCLDFTITIENLTVGIIEFFADPPALVADGEITSFIEDGTYTVTVCGDWPGITDRSALVELIMSVYANWELEGTPEPQAASLVNVAVDVNPIATATGKIVYDPETRLSCFPQDPPVFSNPFCNKVDGVWKMAVNLKNPNDLPMDITWTIDSGSVKSGTIPAFSSIRLGNLELGEQHVLAVYWGEDGFVELRAKMANSDCSNPPTPPEITTYSIPVTAVEAPAPVTEAVVLIPVTGADLGNVVQTGFIRKLMFYLGLSFLGMAFITHSLRNRFLK